MKNYYITETTRKDSRCLAGELLGRGVTAVSVPHPQNSGRGFICLQDWAARYTPAQVAAHKVGNLTADEIEYSVAVQCDAAQVEAVLPQLLYTNHGRLVQWLPTTDGFASPTYGDLRFHKRLCDLAKDLEAATVTVTLSRYGRVLDTVTVSWAKRNAAGQFVGKKRRAGDLLGLIDKAAEPWRYNKRH